MRAGVKPAGQNFTMRQRGRLAGQIGKNHLYDIFGQVRIAVHLPERGGINQVHMTLHQFGESGLGICPGKLAEQF